MNLLLAKSPPQQTITCHIKNRLLKKSAANPDVYKILYFYYVACFADNINADVSKHHKIRKQAKKGLFWKSKTSKSKRVVLEK